MFSNLIDVFERDTDIEDLDFSFFYSFFYSIFSCSFGLSADGALTPRAANKLNFGLVGVLSALLPLT